MLHLSNVVEEDLHTCYCGQGPTYGFLTEIYSAAQFGFVFWIYPFNRFEYMAHESWGNLVILNDKGDNVVGVPCLCLSLD